MKQLFCSILAMVAIAIQGNAQNVGIGTTTPDASAALHVSSSQKGILIPRMDSIQRNAIASPATGLLIYQTQQNGGLYHYTGKAWNKVGGGGNEWVVNANNDIYTAKNVGIANNNPTEKLDINGNIKTTGEIKPNGTAGLANQVLTATGSGSMVWANASTGASGEESTGSGTWGDCSINNITAFQPVGNEDAMADDYFGKSVAISGDYAIIGAHQDDGAVAALIDNGSATILKRNATTGIWESQGKLFNTGVGSVEFGTSVAISGDYAIVGTPYDDEGAGLTDNGSATIYKRNTSTGIWESQGKLINPATANSDNFGWSVAISGDFAIVGARGDDNSTGSATVFKRNTTTGIWVSQGKLTIANPTPFAYFGNSVSISGDYAIVGAPEDAFGTATIFKRNTTTGIWDPLPQGKLTDGFGSSFGGSVSISGNYAIVGDAFDTEGAGLSANGSATIFKRNSITGVWEKQIKLLNTAPASSDYFGFSVSISGDYAIIGAYGDDEGAGITNNGSVTIYKRSGSVWSFVQKFTRPNSNSGEHFGTSVGIDGTTGRFATSAPDVQSGTGLVFFGKVK